MALASMVAPLAVNDDAAGNLDRLTHGIGAVALQHDEYASGIVLTLGSSNLCCDVLA